MQTKLLSTSPHGIALYELSNADGMRVQVINYGARLTAIYVPTAEGRYIDVLAGFDHPDDYMGVNPYFNATIGRVANRIYNIHERAITYHDTVCPKMDAIRFETDHLEMIVEDGLWSLPKYRELLFIR